ncbi:hypothetical protein [Dactylosporangium darangshiense]|uniref:Uncharacterized protein n=1 Tax=Dactylosporangium darangshiense TaxID=579108 RepID=A0ABP8DWM3_9ACTN
MGASGWSYVVEYQPDLEAAFETLQAKVFTEGDYWWAVPGEWGKSARDYPNRPRTIDELFADERVQESGTHSILDMRRVLPDGEPQKFGWLDAAVTSPFEFDRLFAEYGEPEYGTIAPVTTAEALDRAGVEKVTRDHLEVIDDLAKHRWFGRCAVLHDAAGMPTEIYFWGWSGD